MDLTAKAQATKTQIHKWNYTKGNNRVKRQPMKWEEIFTNHLSDKGLISKLYNKLFQPNSKITNNPIKMG